MHPSVDVAVEVHVCRVGAAGRQGATDEGRRHDARRRPATRGEDHGRHRRDEEQLDYAGFGEGNERPGTGKCAGCGANRTGASGNGARVADHLVNDRGCRPRGQAGWWTPLLEAALASR